MKTNSIKLESEISCDIFVVGAGIAGVMAAIEAAKENKKVILASSRKIFSGASFYPGTWGLGLVSPKNKDDEEDFIETIQRVGCGMADEAMVRTFVEEMNPTIEYLEKSGLVLQRAKEDGQKEFIPCFDYKTRSWHGVLAKNAKKGFSKTLEQLGVELYPHSTLLDVIEENNSVSGVVICKESEMLFVKAKAVVLATGGYGGLFKRKLITDDIIGTGQAIALKHGCSLVNMEFMQMMPAFVRNEEALPIVFNEKTFRFIKTDNGKLNLLQKELEERSFYGPFTSRLKSKVIDFVIQDSGFNGLEFKYDEKLNEDMPEFIRTYFDWLKKNKNFNLDGKMSIAMFAHAANGGIKISSDTSTELPGLFACGEVTGGMHGADRIGGLSTANGFVFGIRSGRNAVKYVMEKEMLDEKYINLKASRNDKINKDFWNLKDSDNLEVFPFSIENYKEISEELQTIMMEAAMVVRSEEELQKAFDSIEMLENSIRLEDTEDINAFLKSKGLLGQIVLCKAILSAETLRKESRGSHYRSDYPVEDIDMGKRILITYNNGKILAKFED